MLRLTTLGGLALEGEQGALSGAAMRPRPLGLLALVAAGGACGRSRDKLMAYLWPESDTGHARNCLKQTLFALRHHLNRDLFVPGASVLRLDPRAVTVDYWDFLRAINGRDYRTAVDSYGGPFLDGFHLEGLAEFERWAEVERARLAQRYQVALEALAAGAEVAGDIVGALGWWQRLTEHDPLSSRIALGLLKALVAVGDRADALRYAELHERLLREELNAAPDTGERVFVARLREHVTKH